MAEHQLKRVLVYFQLVADAKRFTRELGHTLRLLRTTAPELCPDLDPLTLYVDGDCGVSVFRRGLLGRVEL
ncbi:hypothetical protein ACFYYN_38160 [Streptomyces sp. NPDC001902]